MIHTAQKMGCKSFIIEREQVYNGPKNMAAVQADYDWICKCMAAL